MYRILLFIFVLSCPLMLQSAQKKIADVAFLPDIHFHDVYAKFEDKAFSGIPMSDNNYAVIRSMGAQLRSTRLFNENYFALKQALTNMAKEGVRLVILPGDFTDDGQPIHVRGLAKVLAEFETQYNMRFFITNGNHDPNQPDDAPAGKPNFLNQDGSELAIYSHDHDKCQKTTDRQGLICSDEVIESGYDTLLTMLPGKGFFPDQRDIYWASPFSHYSPEQYQFDQAQKQARLMNRNWTICNDTAVEYCKNVTDSSYVVEPIAGVWLLAIDANVYVPKVKNGKFIGFSGSGNQGYNGVVKYKPQLLQWVKQVVLDAKKRNKQLIAFSHFPMAPFYDGQEQQILDLLGDDAMQMIRSPTQDTTAALLETGLTFHVGGHMHINDTQTMYRPDKTALINIQAPSLAAYRPAYKSMKIFDNGEAILRTQPLNIVKDFNALFSLYDQEHRYLQHDNAAKIWDKTILDSQTYYEFADHHLRELARLRFVPKEWQAFQDDSMLLLKSARQVMQPMFVKADQLGHTPFNQWLKENKLKAQDFDWTMLDLLHDLYRYRNAGALANLDISPKRNHAYDALVTLLQSRLANFKNHGLVPRTEQNRQTLLLSTLKLLQGFRAGEPDDTLILNLTTGQSTGT